METRNACYPDTKLHAERRTTTCPPEPPHPPVRHPPEPRRLLELRHPPELHHLQELHHPPVRHLLVRRLLVRRLPVRRLLVRRLLEPPRPPERRRLGTESKALEAMGRRCRWRRQTASSSTRTHPTPCTKTRCQTIARRGQYPATRYRHRLWAFER